LYSFQSTSNTSATTAATNTQPEVIECLNGHDAMMDLGAAIARCRMICMGLPVQGKPSEAMFMSARKDDSKKKWE